MKIEENNPNKLKKENDSESIAKANIVENLQNIKSRNSKKKPNNNK